MQIQVCLSNCHSVVQSSGLIRFRGKTAMPNCVFDNIAAMIELWVIAFVTRVWSVALQFQALPENSSSSKRSQVQNPFISFVNHMSCSILGG